MILLFGNYPIQSHINHAVRFANRSRVHEVLNYIREYPDYIPKRLENEFIDMLTSMIAMYQYFLMPVPEYYGPEYILHEQDLRKTRDKFHAILLYEGAKQGREEDEINNELIQHSMKYIKDLETKYGHPECNCKGKKR